MRNKIRQMMKKEEGFTLVELLAVIVILGIIVAIAIPAIGNVVGNASDDAAKAEIQLVEDAARLYHVENKTQGESTVTVEDLEKAGFLEYRSSSTLEENKTEIKVVRDANGNLEVTGHPGSSK